jgi:hypothetical protein
VVDVVNRVRVLLPHVRGLRQKAPEVQVFLRAVAPVEDIRNFLQHLSPAIHKLAGDSVPLMGQLRWRERAGRDSVSLSVGHWTQGTLGLTLAFDMRKGELADEVRFAVADLSTDLAEVHVRCRALSAFLESWLADSGMLGPGKTRPSTGRFGVRLGGA